MAQPSTENNFALKRTSSNPGTPKIILNNPNARPNNAVAGSSDSIVNSKLSTSPSLPNKLSEPNTGPPVPSRKSTYNLAPAKKELNTNTADPVPPPGAEKRGMMMPPPTAPRKIRSTSPPNSGEFSGISPDINTRYSSSPVVPPNTAPRKVPIGAPPGTPPVAPRNPPNNNARNTAMSTGSTNTGALNNSRNFPPTALRNIEDANNNPLASSGSLKTLPPRVVVEDKSPPPTSATSPPVVPRTLENAAPKGSPAVARRNNPVHVPPSANTNAARSPEPLPPTAPRKLSTSPSTSGEFGELKQASGAVKAPMSPGLKRAATMVPKRSSIELSTSPSTSGEFIAPRPTGAKAPGTMPGQVIPPVAPRNSTDRLSNESLPKSNSNPAMTGDQPTKSPSNSLLVPPPVAPRKAGDRRSGETAPQPRTVTADQPLKVQSNPSLLAPVINPRNSAEDPVAVLPPVPSRKSGNLANNGLSRSVPSFGEQRSPPTKVENSTVNKLPGPAPSAVKSGTVQNQETVTAPPKKPPPKMAAPLPPKPLPVIQAEEPAPAVLSPRIEEPKSVEVGSDQSIPLTGNSNDSLEVPAPIEEVPSDTVVDGPPLDAIDNTLDPEPVSDSDSNLEIPTDPVVVVDLNLEGNYIPTDAVVPVEPLEVPSIDQSPTPQVVAVKIVYAKPMPKLHPDDGEIEAIPTDDVKDDRPPTSEPEEVPDINENLSSAPQPVIENKNVTIDVDIEPIDINMGFIGDAEGFIYDQGLDYYLDKDNQIDFAATFGIGLRVDPRPQLGENVDNDGESTQNNDNSETSDENKLPSREARKSVWVKVTKPANFNRADPDLAKARGTLDMDEVTARPKSEFIRGRNYLDDEPPEESGDENEGDESNVPQTDDPAGVTTEESSGLNKGLKKFQKNVNKFFTKVIPKKLGIKDDKDDKIDKEDGQDGVKSPREKALPRPKSTAVERAAIDSSERDERLRKEKEEKNRLKLAEKEEKERLKREKEEREAQERTEKDKLKQTEKEEKDKLKQAEKEEKERLKREKEEREAREAANKPKTTTEVKIDKKAPNIVKILPALSDDDANRLNHVTTSRPAFKGRRPPTRVMRPVNPDQSDYDIDGNAAPTPATPMEF